MQDNILLCTDVYKMGHMEFYPEGTEYIYSYMCCRSDKKFDYSIFFGLQYYLKRYLSQPITHAMVDEFLDLRQSILGSNPHSVVNKMKALASLGYLPLKIKAVPEGSKVPVKNVLMTITNTHPDFAWVVGFVESILLKVWNTMSVATYSHKLYKLCEEFGKETCDDLNHLPFQIHDFGYRGCSSEETSALSGAAHLLNFLGTDTVPAVKLLKDYYNATDPVGLSVPATEHSVMCAYGQENELEAFNTILKKANSPIVSIVSDTWDLWKVLQYDLNIPKDTKIVFRPDSGDPVSIICGDESTLCRNENHGVIRLLYSKYGKFKDRNKKGFSLLPPNIGLIYGDGMTYDRIREVFTRLKKKGFASSNIVFGVGGLLLQQHNRDDLGVAIKATWAQINGHSKNLLKDPVTDHGKKSHTGKMLLVKSGNTYTTVDGVDDHTEQFGELETVFLDGKILIEHTLDDIRKRVKDNTL